MPYRVDFWNDEDAEVPTQNAEIIDELDPEHFDLSTLEFTRIGFLDWDKPLPGGQIIRAVIDPRPEMSFIVEVEGDFNPETGEIRWNFRAVDPETGDWPMDPMAGFLPPVEDEDDPGDDIGWVEYRVKTHSGLDSGTRIENQALVQFDHMGPWGPAPPYGPWVNTIDADAPQSWVRVLPEFSPPQFDVAWTGNAESGFRHFDIYYRREGGGNWERWQEETEHTSAPFSGQVGVTYDFYATSVNNLGIRETFDPTPQATTTVREPEPPPSPDVRLETPQHGATGVARDTILRVSITDTPENFDPADVRLFMDADAGGALISDGSRDYAVGEQQQWGLTQRRDSDDGLTFTFVPHEEFSLRHAQDVKIAVNLSGGDAREAGHRFGFTTKRRAFGGEQRIGAPTDAMPRDPVTVSDSRGRIFIAHADDGQVKLSVSPGPGRGVRTFSAPAPLTDLIDNLSTDVERRAPSMALGPDDTPYLLWEESFADGSRSIAGAWYYDALDIWLNLRLREAREASSDMWAPQMAAGGGSPLYAAWLQAGDDGRGAVHVSKHHAATQTWMNAVKVSAPDAEPQHLSLAAYGPRAAVVWMDERAGETGLYGAGSGDGWREHRLLKSPDGRLGAPAAAMDADQLHLAYVSDGKAVHHARFPADLSDTSALIRHVDGGSNESRKADPAIAVLLDGSAPTPYSKNAPKVMIVWADKGGLAPAGMSYILYNETGYPDHKSFGDYGVAAGSLSPAPRAMPALALEHGSNPYVVWAGRGGLFYSRATAPGELIVSQSDAGVVRNSAFTRTVDARPQAQGLRDVIVELEPADALLAADITVNAVDAPPHIDDIPGALGLTYNFRPSGLEFSPSATITIPYAVDQYAGDAVRVYWYDSAADVWTDRGISAVEHLELAHNEEIRAVRFRVEHFTFFTLASEETPEEDEPIEDQEETIKSVSDSSGCFIATAAFGSADAPSVQALREFRNKYLATNQPGQWFANRYYHHSPSVAAVIETRPVLRTLTAMALLPLSALAYLMLNGNAAVCLAVILFTGLIIALWLKEKRRTAPPRYGGSGRR